MSQVKWIKISTAIFDDEKIKLIEGMPDSDGILVIWIKLLILAGRHNENGEIYVSEGLPYTDSMLAQIFQRKLNTVKMAISTFARFGMIEILDNRKIIIKNWSKHQNIDGLDKIRESGRKRINRFRSRQNDAENAGQDVALCNVTDRYSVTLRNGVDIEEELEEKEEDITAAIESQTAFLEEETSVDDNQSFNDHQRFIKLWTEEFPKFHDETKYSFCGAKDGNAVKRLLKVTSVEKLISLAKRAWRNGGMFNCKFAATINGFAARFNEIQEELRQLDKV